MFGGSSRSVPSHVPAPDRPRELVLYKYDSCPYCRQVAMQVDALGLHGAIRLRDTRTDPVARGELAAATGRTQVPCLFIDGEPLFESADIDAWLEGYARTHAGTPPPAGETS